MAWTLVDEDATGFHSDATSHGYTFPAGAPTAGDWDIIFVNSNTTLAATPSGWTRSLDLIANFGANNQGAYCLTRKAAGGEGDSVTIQMSGNFNTILSWSRWRGGNTIDVATAAVADANPASTTPSVSTGTLAASGELVLAAAALQGSFPTVTPTWSTGYTPLTGVQYNAGTVDEVSSYVGYRTDGGTTSESPQLDWTSTPAAPISDRYAMVVTITQAAGDTTVTPSAVAAVAALPAVTVSTGATATPGAVQAVATIPTPAPSTGQTITPAAIAAAATIPAPVISAGATVTPGSVAAVADVLMPSLVAQIVATPGVVAAAAAVPAPALSTSSTVTPGVVAAVAAVPVPLAGEIVPFGGYGTLTPSVAATSTLAATSAAASTLLATTSP